MGITRNKKKLLCMYQKYDKFKITNVSVKNNPNSE